VAENKKSTDVQRQERQAAGLKIRLKIMRNSADRDRR